MRWIKHQTDASDDVKIKRLEEEFGLNGYAVFFKLLEKVGKEGRSYRLKFEKYPKEILAKEFRISQERLEKILEAMMKLGLIDVKAYKKEEIYVPNMRKYADEYTQRGRKYYEERKYPKENYIKVEQAYIKLKKIKPQGDEWLPIQRDIKTMFKSGRTPKEIIRCMKWMAENDFYQDKWTITTVRKKLPEFLSGELEEEANIPEYAKRR